MASERKCWLIGPISAAADGALYQQIVDRIKREISEGRLKPGATLPSFRTFAEDLLVSVITVKAPMKNWNVKASFTGGRDSAPSSPTLAMTAAAKRS